MNNCGVIAFGYAIRTRVLVNPHNEQMDWDLFGSLQQDETELISLWVAHDLKEICGLLMDIPESRCADSRT